MEREADYLALQPWRFLGALLPTSLPQFAAYTQSGSLAATFLSHVNKKSLGAGDDILISGKIFVSLPGRL